MTATNSPSTTLTAAPKPAGHRPFVRRDPRIDRQRSAAGPNHPALSTNPESLRAAESPCRTTPTNPSNWCSSDAGDDLVTAPHVSRWSGPTVSAGRVARSNSASGDGVEVGPTKSGVRDSRRLDGRPFHGRPFHGRPFHGRLFHGRLLHRRVRDRRVQDGGVQELAEELVGLVGESVGGPVVGDAAMESRSLRSHRFRRILLQNQPLGSGAVKSGQLSPAPTPRSGQLSSASRRRCAARARVARRPPCQRPRRRA